MSFSNFPNPKRTTIIPQNYTKGKTVREYVEHYAHSHKMRADQALAVQGSDVIIWNRTYTNRYCTCQGLDSSVNNNPAVTENLQTGAVEQETKKEFNKLSKKANSSTVSKVLTENGLSSLLDVVNSQYEEDVEVTATLPQTKKVESKQTSLIEEALQLQQKNLGVEFAEQAACPICFSTRRTDSYQPYKGVRLVLDASDFYKVATKEVLTDTSTFPNVFEFYQDSGYVTWELELPCYFRTESIRVFNLDRVSTSFNLSFKEISAVNYTPLNNATLDTRNGLRNILQIKAEVNPVNISQKVRDLKLCLSHVELVLMLSEGYEKIELPALEIPDNVDYVELYLRSRAVLSPNVENIGRNSLFCEKKYGHIWEVTGLIKNFTSAGNLVNLKADTRLIQNSEKLHLLNLFNQTLNSTASGYSR